MTGGLSWGYKIVKPKAERKIIREKRRCRGDFEKRVFLKGIEGDLRSFEFNCLRLRTLREKGEGFFVEHAVGLAAWKGLLRRPQAFKKHDQIQIFRLIGKMQGGNPFGIGVQIRSVSQQNDNDLHRHFQTIPFRQSIRVGAFS